MQYNKEIKLKDGRICVLRNGTEADGQAARDNFNLTHAQTDYLLTYPEENSFTAEQEAQFLKRMTESVNEIEILAEVDGTVVGMAGIESLGSKEKIRHRAEFGISVDKAYWGLGIGRALTNACIKCAKRAGYLQLELEAVAENRHALNLYESAGFVEYGHNPKGFRSRYCGWQEVVLMRLELEGSLEYITLRDRPELMDAAADWFCSKWRVPKEAYVECMSAYLDRETEYGWYLCLDGDQIVGGLGVIENDFHDRKDLTPNVCAVYTEEAYRCQGIAGKLLNMAVEDLRSKGISPVYLLTDHTGFYERYGWEFYCMVQGDGESEPSRMYIHR